MSSDHRDERTIRFFFQLNNQNSFYFGSIERWDKQTTFYFPRYSAVACHKFSRFNSRVFIIDFTRNCCGLQKVKKLSTNSGQFKCVTRKNRYHVSITEFLTRNLYSQVAESVRRPRNILKILYFSKNYQFVQISPGIKPFYDWGRKLFYLLIGEE